jgi:hypothetical protein
MSNLYRGSSKDVSYQVSVHLAIRFQRRILKISQSETRIVQMSFYYCGYKMSFVIAVIK